MFIDDIKITVIYNPYIKPSQPPSLSGFISPSSGLFPTGQLLPDLRNLASFISHAGGTYKWHLMETNCELPRRCFSLHCVRRIAGNHTLLFPLPARAPDQSKNSRVEHHNRSLSHLTQSLFFPLRTP